MSVFLSSFVSWSDEFWEEESNLKAQRRNTCKHRSGRPVCRTRTTKHLTPMDSHMVLHSGGCHCGRVRWRVRAPTSVVAWSCNCSDCYMRGNTHFIVPSERFELLGDSSEFVTTYTFGTHTAKHTFCKVCGITSFYIPRSNPDGVAVTFMCVDPGTLTHVEIKYYDGRNWESSHKQTGIASCSKDTDK